MAPPPPRIMTSTDTDRSHHMQPTTPRPVAARAQVSSQPLISVVVPTFNSCEWMGPTLDSLAAQTERDFEVIVSDGASTDGTLALIETYRPRLPSLTLLSRPDRGVYDAINQALPACRGNWIYVLGSDDCLHASSTLARLAPTLRASTAGLVYGDVRITGPNRLVPSGGRYGGPFTLARLLGQNICHQAVFARFELLNRLGSFDLRFKVWADWDIAQRAFVDGAVQWIDLVVADYSPAGMSSQQQDAEFERTKWARMFKLWVRKPLSLQVPLALVQQQYWDLKG